MKKNILHFFDLYVEAAGEDIIEVKRELEEAGIDYDKSLERTMELFRQAEAELKLEKGEKKREKWMRIYKSERKTHWSSANGM